MNTHYPKHHHQADKYCCDNEELEFILPDLWRASRSVMLFRATVCLIFGLLLFFRPLPAITIAVIIFGFYVAAEGATVLIQSFRLPDKLRGVTLINAIILLILGLAAIAFPWVMGEYAVMFFGAWLLVGSIQYFMLMKVPGHRVKLFFSGIFSIIAGIFFIVAPLIGLLTLGWVFALIFIAAGITMFFVAASMKQCDYSDDE